jgi:hypothetical protein
MVTYGSEARGYALMILATLFMILLATKVVEGRANRTTRWLMALIAALGMLAHMTMLAPTGLVFLWIYLEKRKSLGSSRAMADTLAVTAPAIAACAAVLALILVPAILSPTGMQTGGYNPPTFDNYVLGLSNMESWTAGLTFPLRWLALVALFGIGVAMLVRPPVAMGPRAKLYGLLILGVPIVIFVERIGNAQFARFYLSTAIGLLLLSAEWAALAVRRGKTARALAAAAGVLFVITAVWNNRQLIELQRGQHERAIALMEAKAPLGARAAIATQISAPMWVAAVEANYPLKRAKGCAPAEFMIVLRVRESAHTVMRCGRPMRAIGWSEATDLTGDAWVLYRAAAASDAHS